MSSPRPSSAEPFDPPGVTWSRLSPRLVGARRLVSTIVAAVPLVALVVLGILFSPWFHAGAVAVALLALWEWWVIGRQVPAWGYAERDDDLLVRHGLVFRTLVVVPYGRMQYVDVQAGPVDRRFGIATLQLHTASASTDAVIPGLPPEEAARLRDRLAARGEVRLAGL